jgi:hypothetical protein
MAWWPVRGVRQLALTLRQPVAERLCLGAAAGCRAVDWSRIGATGAEWAAVGVGRRGR